MDRSDALKHLDVYPTLSLTDARKQAKTFFYEYGTLSEDQQNQAMPFKNRLKRYFFQIVELAIKKEQ